MNKYLPTVSWLNVRVKAKRSFESRRGKFNLEIRYTEASEIEHFILFNQGSGINLLGWIIVKLRDAAQCKLLYISPSFIRKEIYNPAWIYDQMQQCLSMLIILKYYLNG